MPIVYNAPQRESGDLATWFNFGTNIMGLDLQAKRDEVAKRESEFKDTVTAYGAIAKSKGIPFHSLVVQDEKSYMDFMTKAGVPDKLAKEQWGKLGALPFGVREEAFAELGKVVGVPPLKTPPSGEGEGTPPPGTGPAPSGETPTPGTGPSPGPVVQGTPGTLQGPVPRVPEAPTPGTGTGMGEAQAADARAPLPGVREAAGRAEATFYGPNVPAPVLRPGSRNKAYEAQPRPAPTPAEEPREWTGGALDTKGSRELEKAITDPTTPEWFKKNVQEELEKRRKVGMGEDTPKPESVPVAGKWQIGNNMRERMRGGVGGGGGGTGVIEFSGSFADSPGVKALTKAAGETEAELSAALDKLELAGEGGGGESRRIANTMNALRLARKHEDLVGRALTTAEYEDVSKTPEGRAFLTASFKAKIADPAWRAAYAIAFPENAPILGAISQENDPTWKVLGEIKDVTKQVTESYAIKKLELEYQKQGLELEVAREKAKTAFALLKKAQLESTPEGKDKTKAALAALGSYNAIIGKFVEGGIKENSTEYLKNTIFLGAVADANRILKDLGLPERTPAEFVEDPKWYEKVGAWFSNTFGGGTQGGGAPAPEMDPLEKALLDELGL